MPAAFARLARKEVEIIIKEGRRVSSPAFSLSYTPAEDGQTKAAFVVSKKVAKTAIGRNLLKRRGRAALHEWLTVNPRTAFCGVFFFKKGTHNMPYQEIYRSLDELLTKIQ